MFSELATQLARWWHFQEMIQIQNKLVVYILVGEQYIGKRAWIEMFQMFAPWEDEPKEANIKGGYQLLQKKRMAKVLLSKHLDILVH